MSTITGAFAGLALACSIAASTFACCFWGNEDGGKGLSAVFRVVFSVFGSFVTFTLIYGALYSDWVLMVVRGNLEGLRKRCE